MTSATVSGSPVMGSARWVKNLDNDFGRLAISSDSTCGPVVTEYDVQLNRDARGQLLSYALADDDDTVFELADDLSTCDCCDWLARHGKCDHQKGLKVALEQLYPQPGRAGMGRAIRTSRRSRGILGWEEEASSIPTRQASAPFPRGYEIEGEIGRGGMGVVYKARQSALGRLVALKMLLHSAHEGDDALARFRTEAEALARLSHPGIVAIHEVGELSGLPFLSMEWCEGGSLDRKLAGRPLPAKEAASLVRSLSLAVQAAHEAKVIHRDLKPANVLLSADGTPKVTDFGLAKKLDEAGQTQTGAVMGTPSYLAPEQAAGGKDVGPAVDVYALGAILYECLTGRPPFQGEGAMQTIRLVCTQEPVPPAQLNPGVPADLETVCLKCLEKEPARRYASAAELADDLGRFSRGEAVRARPAGAVERGLKWARRNPAVAALSAAVLLTFALGAALATGLATWALDEARLADTNADEAARDAEAARKARDDARQSEDLAKAETIRTRAALHERTMIAALHYWERHNVRRAEALLDGVPAELRQTWEVRHLRELCRRRACDPRAGQELLTLEGHAGEVTSVAYRRDGSRLVSGSRDGTVKVWDAKTGEELLTLRGHAGRVTAVAYNPDGSRIASAGADGTVKVWDAKSAEVLLTLEGTKPMSCVSYGPDGSRLASGTEDGTVRVWDAKTGERLLTLNGHAGGVTSVAYGPDGSRIASGSRGESLKVWDAKTGEQLLTLNGHAAGVTSVAYSPDGSRLVSGSPKLSGGRPQTLKVWDAKTGQQVLSLESVTDSVAPVAYSPDGSRIASGGEDHTLKLWDSGTGQELLTLSGHVGRVTAVAYSPDGSRIASGGEDHTIKLWDAPDKQRLPTSK
jgi:WD40 repeat protein